MVIAKPGLGLSGTSEEKRTEAMRVVGDEVPGWLEPRLIRLWDWQGGPQFGSCHRFGTTADPLGNFSFLICQGAVIPDL